MVGGEGREGGGEGREVGRERHRYSCTGLEAGGDVEQARVEEERYLGGRLGGLGPADSQT